MTMASIGPGLEESMHYLIMSAACDRAERIKTNLAKWYCGQSAESLAEKRLAGMAFRAARLDLDRLIGDNSRRSRPPFGYTVSLRPGPLTAVASEVGLPMYEVTPDARGTLRRRPAAKPHLLPGEEIYLDHLVGYSSEARLKEPVYMGQWLCWGLVEIHELAEALSQDTTLTVEEPLSLDF